MLIIREDQMQILKDHMLSQFENRMVKHLQTCFPQQTASVSEEDLHAMVLSGIDRSLSYDVKLEDDVQRFLECMIIYGDDFDENPETSWAGDILRREDVNGTQKMDAIDFHSIFALGGENG